MITHTARVTKLTDLTHDVRVITLQLVSPPEMPFAAGQFVSFEAPKAGLAHPVTRAYSIASGPADPTSIEIVLNLVPGGPGSTHLFSFRVGDEVTFKGPAGTFVLHDYPDRRLLFVATGTGIAPFLSMLSARLPSPAPVTLVWGLRSERDLYYQDELETWARQHPEFRYHLTLSRPSDAWTGHRGRLQPLVEAELGDVSDLAVYLCGNSAMISSVVAMVKARGTCPIHREQYYKDAPNSSPDAVA